MMEDQQTYEGGSNGEGSGRGGGGGRGSGYGSGSGDGYGGEDGCGWGCGYISLRRLFPIPSKYYYLLKGQTVPQKVKIHYDLHNASSQEAIDILVEWYETIQIDKAT